MAGWHVYFDIVLMEEASDWPSLRRAKLFAIRNVLESDGPGAYGIFPRPTDCTNWAVLDRAVRRNCIVPFDLEFYRLGLEIRPGFNLIIREASHFFRPPAR